MAFDAGMLYAVLHEIRTACLGARVEKVHQPTKDELVLLLRGKRLSVNIGSVCPRIALTHLTKDNPASPPMLCMLLRKHLGGALLEEISQCGYDRIARLVFSGYDEMGFPTKKILYAELMGKYSNLILTDEKEKILAVAKPVDFSDSEIRQLLPGLIYTPPAAPEKTDPRAVTRDAFFALLHAYPSGRGTVRFLTDSFAGTATVVAREIVYRATGSIDTILAEADAEKLCAAFFAHFSALTAYDILPYMVRGEGGEPIAYGYLPYLHLAPYPSERADSFAALFDSYFGERDRVERIRSRAADLVRLVTHTEARLTKKLALQKAELTDSERGEEYRRLGDLITAEIYRLKRGMTRFTATDYSVSPPAAVEVELDRRLSPAANAQRFYKLYSKAKTASEMLSGLIASTERELAYIESVSAFLSRAETETDLVEIRDELYRSGYASRMKKHTPQKQLKARPLELQTSGGYRVLCGRNNLQNELITFRLADKGDLWFHAKGVPGSHVVLVCGGEEPPEADYTEAAQIAATYSSATGDLVAVDYTRVKNVKKPPASKPGYVTYKTNFTAYVKPKTKNNTWQKREES